MNKLIFFILLLAVSLGYIFDIDKKVASNFNSPFETIKRFYIDTATSINEVEEEYFSQVETIEKLQKENIELRNYKLKYQASEKEVKTILENLENSILTTKQARFTRVLSYIDFDDYTKVWLDLEKKDNSILGIVSDEYAAGIVINQNGKAKALLNGNEKCNYATFIGENKAPGIVHYIPNSNKLVVKYIPIWFEIKEGDEVITSGMDNIFFEGLKVGKVVSIKKMQDIQEATIIPYAKVLKQKSFFVYKRTIEKKKTVIKDSKKETTK